MEIKNKLTVTRGWGVKDNVGKKGNSLQGTCIRSHGKSQRVLGSRVGVGNWQGGVLCGEIGDNCTRTKIYKIKWKKTLKMELPFDPVIPLKGINPMNPETSIQKNVVTPMFIEALFTIAKIWKQPKCPLVDKWLKYRFTQWNTMQQTDRGNSCLLRQQGCNWRVLC